jgi:hypothetical protein
VGEGLAASVGAARLVLVLVDAVEDVDVVDVCDPHAARSTAGTKARRSGSPRRGGAWRAASVIGVAASLAQPPAMDGPRRSRIRTCLS